MEPAGKLDLDPRMTGPDTVAVMRALMADGVPARFVGGCVRDAFLGRPVTDIDIATAEPPDRVVALLEAAGLKAIPTGIDHGTVTAVAGGVPFEVTTLRLDVETFGRRARVSYTDDWEADAHRRDFTMNALFCDPDGTLYDPTGGLPDLRAGHVRFVGAARDRIQEDVLRLLRFFRFHAWYGAGAPDREALLACRKMAPEVTSLSAERVWSELRRLLLAPSVADVLDLMADWDVLPHVMPEAGFRAVLSRLVDIETGMGTEPDPVRRLAVLLDIDDTGVRAFADRLRLSRDETRRFRILVTPPARPSPVRTEAQNRVALYRLGADRFADLVMTGWAAAPSAADTAWQELAGLAARRPIPDFPLRGEDVLALGVKAGKKVGALLSDVERWWIDNDFRPDRKACLERLKDSVR